MDPVPGAGVPADSPTAPVEPSNPLEALSREQRDEFWKSGTLPDGASSDDPAPSGDQSASTDANAKAVSETAKPGEKPKRNLESRHAEVDARVAELKQKLAIQRELEEQLAKRDRQPVDSKPSDSSTDKPTKAQWQRYSELPNAPKHDEFDSYADYIAALTVFVTDQHTAERDRRISEQQQREARIQSFESTVSAALERVNTYKQDHPDYAEQVSPDLLAIKPAMQLRPDEPIGPHNVLVDYILKSEYTPQLLLHFSTPDGAKEWGEMMKLRPDGLLLKFGRIEARLASQAESAGGAPPVKSVTSAPNPPTTLGKKPSAPADREREAIEAGDFRAYYNAANARELATRR